MLRLGKKRLLLLAVVLVAGAAGLLVGSGSFAGTGSSGAAARTGSGPWRMLPAAPVTIDANLTSVWTGTEMVVSGQSGAAADGSLLEAVDVAAAYNPVRRTWRRLAAPPELDGYCRRSSVWTGTEVLVWGCGQVAFNPLRNDWRRLPPAPAGGGIVVWTGTEMIGWGGGCCGDSSSEGAAYNTATNTWRRLARSPLAPEQRPLGAWNGRELILFVSGVDAADGKPFPAGFARAAAYDPAADTWRRIQALPAPRHGASAAWHGREVFVVGGRDAQGAPARVGFAYDPAMNHFRRLPAMRTGRTGATAVSARQRLLLWGGETEPGSVADGLALDPRTNRWLPLAAGPLHGRFAASAVWTGRELIVWGLPRSAEGAAFTPDESGARDRHPLPPLPACC